MSARTWVVLASPIPAHDVELEVQRAYTSPYATHVQYTVER